MGDQWTQLHSAAFCPLCPTENIFSSSLGTHRLHRKRPLSTKREPAAASFLALEEADHEEKEAFFAFIQQLGAGDVLPE